MNKADCLKVKMTADLAVREYFDHYLEVTLPAQMKVLDERHEAALVAHDANAEAHGGVRGKVEKLKWSLMVFAATLGGGAGAGLSKLLSLF